MASIGDLNQMKVSERRLLLQHVLHELRSINRLSLATSQSLESYIRQKSGMSPYPEFLLEGSATVDEILENAQLIKNETASDLLSFG